MNDTEVLLETATLLASSRGASLNDAAKLVDECIDFFGKPALRDGGLGSPRNRAIVQLRLRYA